jgi:uridylate kinase
MPSYPVNNLSSKRIILSLGGSLIVPNEINVEYLKQFRAFILKNIEKGWSFVLVTGGGAPARKYIDGASAILDGDLTDDDKDWLGIHATRFNAHLVRTVFRKEAQPAIITDPEIDELDENKKVIVVSGWKPGWSTDYVSNKIAERYQAPIVINLSNIKQVYDSDPKKNPDAKPIEDMLWKDFRAMVGDKWTPGMNTPYDPIAAKLASEINTAVLVMDGTNLENLQKCIDGQEFIGTMLHN